MWKKGFFVKLVFVLVIMFNISTAYGQSMVTQFEGIWRCDSSSEGILQYIFKGRDFELLIDGIPEFKGTFTFTENEIISKITHFYGTLGHPNGWDENFNKEDIDTFIYNISSDKLILSIEGEEYVFERLK
jgi:hypothetical protein